MIKEIARNPEDKTQVSFVFANQTVDDIILKEELDDIVAKHDNINVRPPRVAKMHATGGIPALYRAAVRQTGSFKTRAIAVSVLNIPRLFHGRTRACPFALQPRCLLSAFYCNQGVETRY